MATENACHPDTEKTEKYQSEDTQCKKKKLKFLRFSLSMEDTEMGGLQEPSHPQSQREEKDIEDDCLFDDDLLHSLANMSLNLVDDQDSDTDNPSCNTDWQLIDRVVTLENTEITYISSQICDAIEEQKNWFLKAFKDRKYVAPKRNTLCLEDTKSAKITISNVICNGKDTNDGKSGTPVVLNFTGTNNYLACDIKEEKKILTVKTSDLDRTKIKVCEDDEKSSLIFYMVQKYDGLRYFESVRYRGWYIHTINDNAVKMEEGNSSDNCSFVLE